MSCSYQMLTAVVSNGERPQFPSHCPPSYIALALECMDGDHRRRPSMEAVVARLSVLRYGPGALVAGEGVLPNSMGLQIEEMLCVPKAVAKSEALRMIRMISTLGGEWKS